MKICSHPKRITMCRPNIIYHQKKDHPITICIQQGTCLLHLQSTPCPFMVKKNILMMLGIAHILSQSQEKTVMGTIGRNVGVLVCQILIVPIQLHAASMGAVIHVYHMKQHHIRSLKRQVLRYHVQNFTSPMTAVIPPMNANMLENLDMVVLIILCAVIMDVPIFVSLDMLTMEIATPATIYHLIRGILCPAQNISLTRRFTMDCTER